MSLNSQPRFILKFPFALFALAPFIAGCAVAQNANETTPAQAAPAPAQAPLVISTAPISVAVTEETTAHDIRPDTLGYNTSFIRGGSWDDAAMMAALKKLQPGHLRYPAGTIANYWDWRAGWVQKNVGELPHGWSNLNPNPYKLEDLKKAVDAVNATPLFVLNMLHSTLDEQMEMLRAAQKLGLPVKAIELGNEFYLPSSDYIKKYPNAEDYARDANVWAAKIKAEFPDAQVAAIGSAAFPQDNPRRVTWNDRVFPLLQNIDAMTLHVYQSAGVGTQPSNSMEATGLTGEKKVPQAKNDMWANAELQQKQWDEFNTDAGLQTMLGLPAARYENLGDLKKWPDGKELWLTEYNLFDRVGPVRGTWAHGLFAVTLALNFLRDDRIQILTFHQLDGPATFSTVFDSENAFSDLDIGTPPKTKPGTFTATGQSNRLLGRAMKNASSSRALEFSPNPQFEVRVKQGALIGRAFTVGKRQSAIIVNNTAQSFVLGELPLPKGSHVTQVSGDPRAYVPQGFHENNSTLDKELPVAAYSVTLVEGLAK